MFSYIEKPSIIKEPEAITVGIGEPFTLSLSAKGVPDITYQWYKKGNKVSGGTEDTIYISEAIIEDSARYYCNITNEAGWVQSKDVTVRVFDKSNIVSLQLKVNNPDPKKDCHYFFPEDLEIMATMIVSKKVVVTRTNKIGKFCNITACSKNPCLNDGKCALLQNGEYKCGCQSAWTGQHCEKDLNECTIPGFSACYGAGNCSNINGSFICQCPDRLNGRRCEFKKDICQPATCNQGFTCLPKAHGNYSCVQKASEITLSVKSDRLMPWSEEKRYFLEDWLNQIIKTQQTSPGNKRKRRDSDVNFDFTLCTAHILNTTTNADQSLEVKIALDCRGMPNEKSDFVNSVCTIFLSRSSSVISFAQCGQPNKMQTPVIRNVELAVVNVNVVVENQDGMVLSGTEALGLIKQKDLLQEMVGKYNGNSAKLAYVEKIPKEPKDYTITIIIAVTCAVVAVAIIVGVVVSLKRRKHGYQRQSSVMQKRVATNDTKTLDLVGYSNNAYSDEIKSDGSFMFEVPSTLKASNKEE